MTVYSGPVFEMAVNQFNVIANHLEIPMDERDRILMPKRAITVSCRFTATTARSRIRRLPRAASPHHGPDQAARAAPSVDIGEWGRSRSG